MLYTTRVNKKQPREIKDMNMYDDDEKMVDIEESIELDDDATRASVKRADCKKYDYRSLNVDPYADKYDEW